MRIKTLLGYCLLAGIALAQGEGAGPAASGNAVPAPPDNTAPTSAPDRVVLPTGTKILLVLKNTVSTKNARPGDGVYLETSFPVTQNDRVAIPAGTYVQGVIDRVQRSGRVKGKAELLIHFTTLIYPNGYTVRMPGALESASGAENAKVKDSEGNLQAEGTKGRDAATIATSAGTGGLIGGLADRSAKGAAIGGGIGAGVGLLTTLFTRGEEVRLENGSSVEMVLERPLEVDMGRFDPNARLVSTSNNRPGRERKTLAVPASNPGPQSIPEQPK